MSTSDMTASTAYKVLDALGFTAILIGAEQIVAAVLGLHDSSWKLGVFLLFLGVLFYSATDGWRRMWGRLTSLHRIRLVWPDTPPSLVDEAKRRRIRVEVGQYMRDLYNTTARHAIGMAGTEADLVVQVLQRDQSGSGETKDPIRGLASNLFVELRSEMHERIQPVLDNHSCDSDQQLASFLRAWGRLFKSYQTLVWQTHIATLNLRVTTWDRHNYQRWREQDAVFIEKMRAAEHMEGCGELARAIKEIGWQDECRPARHSSPS